MITLSAFHILIWEGGPVRAGWPPYILGSPTTQDIFTPRVWELELLSWLDLDEQRTGCLNSCLVPGALKGSGLNSTVGSHGKEVWERR